MCAEYPVQGVPGATGDVMCDVALGGLGRWELAVGLILMRVELRQG